MTYHGKQNIQTVETLIFSVVMQVVLKQKYISWLALSLTFLIFWTHSLLVTPTMFPLFHLQMAASNADLNVMEKELDTLQSQKQGRRVAK